MLFNRPLIILALAIFAIAGRTEKARTANVHTRRSDSRSLKTRDGLFNGPKATVHKAHARRKYRRSGNGLGDGNLVIQAENEAKQTVPLKFRSSSQSDFEWTASVTVGKGKPQQKFIMDIDTGSGDTWVPLVGCQSCQGKNLFDPSASKTNVLLNQPFFRSYEDDSNVTGIVFQDKMTLGGLTIKNLTMGGGQVITGDLIETLDDGIMGLSFPSSSAIGALNPVLQAQAEGLIDKAEFSLKLTQKNASLFIGGRDKSLFTGKTEFHPLVSDNQGFWEIGPATVSVNGVVAESNISTVIDSGTPGVLASNDDANLFFKSIPDATFNEDQEVFTVPCNSFSSLNITFNWGGQDWPILDPNVLNFGKIDKKSNDCVMGIFGLDDPTLEQVWIVGDVFLTSVYSTYSFDNLTVGFSTLA